MSNFVRAANPIWWLPDLTGVSLNDEYWAFFQQNVVPYVFQDVFHDPDGLTPWSNPVQFQPSGTLPNDLYFDQSETYRISIRHGSSETDPLIWLIENFVPGEGNSAVDANPLLLAENMVTNPQFVDINFVSPVTFTVAGTYNIAPGWDLVLSGSGTTKITQVTTRGEDLIEGSPSYYLKFESSNWTSAYLEQTFHDNGSIFNNGENSLSGVVAIAYSAFCDDVSRVVTVSYVPSTGTPTTLINKPVATGAFDIYKNIADLNPSTNTDTGTNAYVKLRFALPATGIVSISNIQFVGQSNPWSGPIDREADAPLYAELTYERMVDHEFNVYRNSIIIQPKDTILTGWDFPLNPWQFTTKVSTATASKCYYTADQTIYYQRTNSANNVGTANSDLNYAFTVNANSASDNQFAIIQYVDSSTMAPYWGSALSSLVKARFFSNSSDTMRVKMRLIYQNTTPATISSIEPILSWAGPGTDPVFSSDWTVVIPQNDPAYTLSNNTFDSYSFDKFILPSAMSSTTPVIGLVFYTYDDMINTNGDFVSIESISLVPNDFAIDSNPKTFDQVLRECQFYYEKSYDNSVVPGSVSVNQSIIVSEQWADPLNGGNLATLTGIARIIYFPYNTVKRTITPTVTLYSPDTGTANTVRVIVTNNGSSHISQDVTVASFWTHGATGSKSSAWFPSSISDMVTPSGAGFTVLPEAYATFHYTVDARLGLIP